MAPITGKDFSHLKVGDKVYRWLVGSPHLQTEHVVTGVTRSLVKCGVWTFDRLSGVEEYPAFRWGYNFGVTGSILEDHPDTPLPPPKPVKAAPPAPALKPKNKLIY